MAEREYRESEFGRADCLAAWGQGVGGVEFMIFVLLFSDLWNTLKESKYSKYEQ